MIVVYRFLTIKNHNPRVIKLQLKIFVLSHESLMIFKFEDPQLKIILKTAMQQLITQFYVTKKLKKHLQLQLQNLMMSKGTKIYRGKLKPQSYQRPK